jgi:GntR family transcriptional regulator, transcriptional repressor for pyruvate dehydrogenase complex
MVAEADSGGRRRVHKTYQQIIMHIRGAISSGELRPGDRLPPETELARSLGVSRPTVREALKVLEAFKVLESSTGPAGGTFVRTLSGVGVADSLRDSITLLLDVDELTLEELWASREAIELRTAAMAAVRRTEQDLATMRGTIQRDEHKEFDTYFPDITFHRAIADASGNRLLSMFMLSIHLTLKTLADRYVLPEAKQTSQDQHRLIYEAIVDRDATLARARMEEHLRMAYEVYRLGVPRGAEDLLAGKPERLTADGSADESRPEVS